MSKSMNNLFNFPYYFYNSLCCPKEKFIKAWNSIPDENKKDINIRAAVGITCIKLSDDLFYKDFNLSEDCLIEYKKIDIVLNVDDIFLVQFTRVMRKSFKNKMMN